MRNEMFAYEDIEDAEREQRRFDARRVRALAERIDRHRGALAGRVVFKGADDRWHDVADELRDLADEFDRG